MRYRLLPLLALALFAVSHVAARAQSAPLPPGQVPDDVAAAIAQQVQSQNYVYGGDCQQFTAAQSGDVCSLTTAQNDGSWQVQLFAAYADVGVSPYPYAQFARLPDLTIVPETTQPAASVPAATPSGAPSGLPAMPPPPGPVAPAVSACIAAGAGCSNPPVTSGCPAGYAPGDAGPCVPIPGVTICPSGDVLTPSGCAPATAVAIACPAPSGTGPLTIGADGCPQPAS